MSTLMLGVMKELRAVFANTNKAEDLDTLPPAVRYYMCGGNEESGEPCIDHKFHTHPPCNPN